MYTYHRFEFFFQIICSLRQHETKDSPCKHEFVTVGLYLKITRIASAYNCILHADIRIDVSDNKKNLNTRCKHFVIFYAYYVDAISWLCRFEAETLSLDK